jgi:hypothetical protein
VIGSVVSIGSFRNLFFQFNWHIDITGSKPIGSLVYFFWLEFISFGSFSCEVVKVSLFLVQWSLCSLDNICLSSE